MSPLMVWTVIVFVPLALGAARTAAAMAPGVVAFCGSGAAHDLGLDRYPASSCFGQRTLRPANYSSPGHDRGVRHHRTHPPAAPEKLTCPFASKNSEVPWTSEFCYPSRRLESTSPSAPVKIARSARL